MSPAFRIARVSNFSAEKLTSLTKKCLAIKLQWILANHPWIALLSDKLFSELSTWKLRFWPDNGWKSRNRKVVGALWRIWPTIVSLLLKSEPIEINKIFNFLVEGIVDWKFLKASRAPGNASVRNGIEIKINENYFVTRNGYFPVEDRSFMLWINENILLFFCFRRNSWEILTSFLIFL